jgi:hypothetical protein
MEMINQMAGQAVRHKAIHVSFLFASRSWSWLHSKWKGWCVRSTTYVVTCIVGKALLRASSRLCSILIAAYKGLPEAAIRIRRFGSHTCGVDIWLMPTEDVISWVECWVQSAFYSAFWYGADTKKADARSSD